MVDRFLDAYKTLERVLEEKYREAPRHFNSLVMEYLNDPESEPYREDMDLCREVRNLLVHRADMQGEPPIMPSQALIAKIEEIVAYATNPPLAISVATPAEQLVTTHPGQRTLTVMHKMTQSGYSHIPVLDYGKFVGIFSVSTLFSFAKEYPERGIGQNSRIGDFLQWLDIDSHCTERFCFMPQNVGLFTARHAFETVGSDKKRLAMILLTKTGKPNEEILGVLTPWDVMKK